MKTNTIFVLSIGFFLNVLSACQPAAPKRLPADFNGTFDGANSSNVITQAIMPSQNTTLRSPIGQLAIIPGSQRTFYGLSRGSLSKQQKNRDDLLLLRVRSTKESAIIESGMEIVRPNGVSDFGSGGLGIGPDGSILMASKSSQTLYAFNVGSGKLDRTISLDSGSNQKGFTGITFLKGGTFVGTLTSQQSSSGDCPQPWFSILTSQSLSSHGSYYVYKYPIPASLACSHSVEILGVAAGQGRNVFVLEKRKEEYGDDLLSVMQFELPLEGESGSCLERDSFSESDSECRVEPQLVKELSEPGAPTPQANGISYDERSNTVFVSVASTLSATNSSIMEVPVSGSLN